MLPATHAQPMPGSASSRVRGVSCQDVASIWPLLAFSGLSRQCRLVWGRERDRRQAVRCGDADMPDARWQARCGCCGKQCDRHRRPKRQRGAGPVGRNAASWRGESSVGRGDVPPSRPLSRPSLRRRLRDDYRLVRGVRLGPQLRKPRCGLFHLLSGAGLRKHAGWRLQGWRPKVNLHRLSLLVDRGVRQRPNTRASTPQ